MAKNNSTKYSVSAAFFCPQTQAADEAYLSSLHSFLLRNTYGRILLEEVAALADAELWEIFASVRPEVRGLSHGPKYLAVLRDWAERGISGPLSKIRSNITSLPLLAVMQLGQYLRYLEAYQQTHREFVAQIQEGGGGVHGYCGGLPAAMSIACAEDEAELVKYAAVAMRVTVGIGAYTEASDEDKGAEQTLLAIRLKYEGQGLELTRRFPGTYVAAITDPRSISIGGSAASVSQLFDFASSIGGLRVQKIDLGGSAHNPANVHLAAELCRICRESCKVILQLPSASQLKVPLRSNQTGKLIQEGSLIDDLIETNLAACCQWFELLKGVAQDLVQSPRLKHEFVVFGWMDCVTLSPFYQSRIQVNKIMAKDLILKEPTQGQRELVIDKDIELEEQKSNTPEDDDHVKVENENHRKHEENPQQFIFPNHAIAIVGASCRLPGASNMDELWKMLAKGTNNVQELSSIDRFDIPGSFRLSQSGSFKHGRTFYGNFIHDVKSFDHAFFGISSREAANLDPQQRIALELSYEALEDAGYLTTQQRKSNDNVGCFIGLVLAEYTENTNSHAPTVYNSVGTVGGFICGRISHTYGWSGPSEMFNTACSSSMVAINRACKAIQAGECRMAVAGGVNVLAGIHNYLDLAKAGFLSPTGQCKPFDASADGYCRADGAGILVLKPLAQAQMDGDRILGVIAGVATNQGGLSSSLTYPDPKALQALYRAVLDQAGIHPEHVTFVEAHGTGTQVGDPLEMESIRRIFGRSDSKSSNHDTHSSLGVMVGSIKANVGHSEPAAGVTGVLKVLTMLQHRQIPPQVAFQEMNPKLEPPRLIENSIHIPRSVQPWVAKFRVALVNSYGAAGSNGALICCDPPRSRAERPASTSLLGSLPLLVTAKSPASLIATAKALGTYLSQHAENLEDPEMYLVDVSFTLSQRRQRHQHIALIIAKTLRQGAQLLASLSLAEISTLPTRPPARTVLVFSGQSSQKIFLPKSLSATYSVFRSYLEECDTEFRALRNVSMLPAIFQTDNVNDIAMLQCGIFAVQYASARCWLDAGLQPDALVGHSLGELTALAVSGVLSFSDAIKLITTRGHLIEEKWGPEKGAMLAVECTAQQWEDIAAVLGQEHDDRSPLEIACYNGPTSLVVAGSVRAITAAENTLRPLRIRTTRVHTSHGFHSALTEPVLADVAAVAESLTWNQPRIPIYSCSKIPESKKRDISGHMRQPVYFSHAIRHVEEILGPCHWLEAGFDTPITAMVRRACRNPQLHVFQSLKTQGRPRPADIITDAVAGLWQAGIFLKHWAFLPLNDAAGRACSAFPVWLPPYQFAKTQHWVKHVDRAQELYKELELVRSKNTAGPVHNPEQAEEAGKGRLVTRLPNPSTTGCIEFAVNSKSPRFHEVVKGHLVAGRPLCPAPLYMESTMMGVLLLLEDQEGGEPLSAIKDRSIVFKNFRVSNPLSLEPQGDMVLLRLESIPGEKTWNFWISSIDTARKSVLHADGIVSLSMESILDGFQRIVSADMRRFAHSPEKEILRPGRAYGLFSRVVKYERFFKGIQSLELDQHQALATIKLPDHQPHRSESRAWKILDAITVDTCVHVVGLLINISDSLASEEVAVMVSINHAVLSPAFKMEGVSEWRAYASFADHPQQPTGDVFVCSPEGVVVAMFNGCRLSRLPLARLERVLDAAFASSALRKIEQHRFDPHKVGSEANISSSSALTNGVGSNAMMSGGAIDKARMALRELLSECTGIESSKMSENKSLEELGLHSLAAAELSEELSKKFDIEITSHELADKSLAALDQLLNIQNATPRSTSNQSALPQATSENSRNVEATAPRKNRYYGGDNKSDLEREKFFNILIEVLGARLEDLEPQTSLDELGLDSLSIIDLRQELEDHFSMAVDLVSDSKIQEILTLLGIANEEHDDTPPRKDKTDRTSTKEVSALHSNFVATPAKAAIDGFNSIIENNPFKALKELDVRFEFFARKHGIFGYWKSVAPFQEQLTIAYIVEGFAEVGCDLRQHSSGEQVPLIQYLKPKYHKLVRRLWEILERHSVVSITSRDGENMPQTISRGRQMIDSRPASQLLREFDVQFPSYVNETRLIGLTGPRLAECLSGRVDSVAVMFGSAASLKIMEDYYSSSPISTTLTNQLSEYLVGLLSSSSGPSHRIQRRARILEVGGGTGGTTRWLAKALVEADIPAQYTFTDISPSLVRKARNKFQLQYPWMEFTTFNLEENIKPEFRGHFDIVVATNTVHATTDRTASVRRMGEALVPKGGLVVLAELTCHIDWCDICFGLLDGWWFFDGPMAPLQTAPEWMETFAEAGFSSVGYSTGDTLEAKTAQLLVASNMPWGIPKAPTIPPVQLGESGYRLQTMVYKEVDGVKIHADIYYPARAVPSPRPIALMIHGGGHMLLSRRAIRASQTRHLLRLGFVPVSIDYRLCPEINLVEGPINDVCDAYRWLINNLPAIARKENVTLDPSRVVVVGWSSGGHLAMSLGWMAQEKQMPLPKAVLAFYAPVDFESGELDSERFVFLPKPQMSLEQILSSLSPKPITSVASSSEDSELGWVHGDARSELFLTISQQGIALPVLLNGLDASRNLDLRPPSPAHIASISPLARLRAKQYTVPTFIIHGSNDKVIPFSSAERFVTELREEGVKCELLSVKDGKHLFDLHLNEGTQKWEDMVAPGYRFLLDAVSI